MRSCSICMLTISAALVFDLTCTQERAVGEPLSFAPALQAPGVPIDGSSQEATPDAERAGQMPAHLRRQIVQYQTTEAKGTIVIDTPHTYLYYVLGQGRALRYGIGVGREGFTWAGTQAVARKQEWPDWHPPEEMIERQPYLPRMMAGGPGNPLGARAMYLGNTMYRIHGTNAPDTIGKRVSSGCIRLLNEDVIDLFDRVSVGTKVVVLPFNAHPAPNPISRNEPLAGRSLSSVNSSVGAHGLY